MSHATPGAILQTLHRLIFQLAAFSGMEMENMSRGHAWRFLDIGRRLERAINLIANVRAVVATDHRLRGAAAAARVHRQHHDLPAPLFRPPGDARPRSRCCSPIRRIRARSPINSRRWASTSTDCPERMITPGARSFRRADVLLVDTDVVDLSTNGASGRALLETRLDRLVRGVLRAFRPAHRGLLQPRACPRQLAPCVYDITHRTTYGYGADVSVSHHLAHLHPRDCHRSRSRTSSSRSSPRRRSTPNGVDYYGNTTTFFTINSPHDRLVVTARSRAQIAAPRCPRRPHTPPWQQVRDRCASDVLTARQREGGISL